MNELPPPSWKSAEDAVPTAPKLQELLRKAWPGNEIRVTESASYKRNYGERCFNIWYKRTDDCNIIKIGDLMRRYFPSGGTYRINPCPL